ncbi:hypothetical protein J3R82DRAFT_521 [Butyriboletus roseoflavus]|nr:hypothetical protein J3R82DRAFT_521 [Butyriboletus roseoflavus]
MGVIQRQDRLCTMDHIMLMLWTVLPARTRLYVSMTVCTVGAAGIFVSHYLEKKFPAEET